MDPENQVKDHWWISGRRNKITSTVIKIGVAPV